MRSLSTMAAMIIEHLLCMQTIQQFSTQNTLYTNYSSSKSTIIRLRFYPDIYGIVSFSHLQSLHSQVLIVSLSSVRTVQTSLQ